MDSLDLQVLQQARAWRAEGHDVWLVTVLETWGSAPRPPGALLAMRGDGLVAGSVSGGCVEDDLIDRVRKGERVATPSLVAYGVSKEEAARFGLPCGGNLRLVQEPLGDTGWIDEVLERTERHELVARTVDLASGQVRVEAASRGEAFSFDGQTMRALYGPRWRMLVIGAGQLSRALAQMALGLDFEVIVCDPREEYHLTWDVAGTTFSTAMPDDLAVELRLDPHTAVVAVTHDPKLDDLALLEALKSPAFYVGALRLARQHREEKGAARLVRPERRRDRTPARPDRPRHRQPHAGRDRGLDPGRGRRRQERRRADAEEAGGRGGARALTRPA
jgi:xanthine dehydrogenase accessory factor